MIFPGEIAASVRGPGRRGLRPVAIGISAVYLVVLGLFVFVPGPVQDAASRDAQGRFGIGWLADAIRNVLLFLPLGAGLALASASRLRTLATATALATSIELIQSFIPGRFSSPIDVGTNTFGAWFGAALFSHRVELLLPTRARATRCTWIATLVSASILILGTLALGPSTPHRPYFGGHTPQLAQLAQYPGRVLEARVGHASVSKAGPVADSRRLAASLEAGAPIRIRFERGPAPAGLAPLVTVHDDLEREILLVGMDGEDLFVRRRVNGARFGLENPAHRWPLAWNPFRPGESSSLQLMPERGHWRARVDERVLSDQAWSPGRSWALVVPSQLMSEVRARWVDALWVALLIFPVAFYARRSIAPLCGLAGLAVLLVALPPALACAASAPGEWLAFLASAAIGIGLGDRASRRAAPEQGMS